MIRERTSRLTGPLLPAVFAGWTLFVWVGRMRNLANDPEPTGRWTAVGVTAFVIFGSVLAVSLIVGRPRGDWRGRAGPPLVALAALTTVVWLVRAVEIALDDHPIGFIVVHVVLAVVSIGLAAGSVLALRAQPSVGTPAAGEEERVPAG